MNTRNAQGATRPPQPPHEPPEETTDGEGLPPLADDETGEDGGELAEDLPADEEGDLLDDSTSDEELGADDLGIDTGADEGGWTKDSEGDESGQSEDVDGLGQSEYGWTTDLEEQGTEDWDEDLGDWDDSASVLDDDGDEGAEEETNLDLTFDPLGTEDDSEDEDAELDAADFCAEDRSEAIELPPSHDESRVMLRSLGPAETNLSVLVWTGGHLVGGGQGLFVTTDEGALTPSDRASALEAEDVTSIAGGANGEIVVGTLLGGALVSTDGGRSFRAANAWAKGSRPSTSSFVCSVSGVLVLRTGEGALYTSADAGASWRAAPLEGRLLAHAVSADRLVGLVATRGGPAIVTSDDGSSFRLGPLVPRLESLARAADVHMAAGGDLVVVGSDEVEGVLASHDGGATFEVWSAVPRASALAVDPSRPDTCALALSFPGRDVAAVVRTTDAGASFSTLFDLGKLRKLLRLEAPADAEIENRVNGLAFAPTPRGGAWALLVASTAGGLVVKVRDEPAPGASDARPGPA